MIKINTIHLGQMPNGAHMEFIRCILAAAEGCPAIVEKGQPHLDNFRRAVEAETGLEKYSHKNALTDEVAKADAERDKLLNGLKAAARAFRAIPVPEMKEAAEQLTHVLKEKGGSSRAQLYDESGRLMSLIKLLQGTYAPQVELLNLTTMVNLLKEANDRTCRFMVLRNEMSVSRTVGAMRAARRRTDEAYHMLARMVNSLVMVFGEEDYAHFVAYANELILGYKRNVLAKYRRKG